MTSLLRLSALIDGMNARIGRGVIWLVLVAVLVSAVNAIIRKIFNVSSNAFLELQWYLFAAVFLFCAPYALQKNDHVRIDVVSGRFSQRTRIWLELFGTLAFLMPMALMVVYLSWPVFMNSYVSNEQSSNAGGLVIWPARLLLPVAFVLLILQGVSQAIKCWGFLQGQHADPTEKEHRPSAEEELAEAIKARLVAEEVVSRVDDSDAMVDDLKNQKGSR